MNTCVCVSRYEGLVNGHDRCHVRGVFTYADGDRYVGEYRENEMDGFGVYAWKATGTVYRGEWKESRMHGCGVKMVRQGHGNVMAEEGEFVEDEWKGVTKACSVKKAREAAAYADIASQMAKVFQVTGAGDRAAKKSKGLDSIIRSMNDFRTRKRFLGLF